MNVFSYSIDIGPSKSYFFKILNLNIEIYPGKFTCIPNGDFTVKLNTQPTSLCYKTPNMIVSQLVPPSGEIGPFTDSTTVVISPAPCGTNPTCFKMIYLPKPDCKNPNLEWSQGRTNLSNNTVSLKVVPNPFMSDQLTIQSEMRVGEYISYIIYNTSGYIIHSGQFTGESQIIPFYHPSGVYILKYLGIDGEEKHTKFVKM